MNDKSIVRWRKSTRSAHEGGECVEVASLSPTISIRDSKNPDGPKLTLTPAAWQTLTHRIKNGEHDLV
jgi:hypothetical protein